MSHYNYKNINQERKALSTARVIISPEGLPLSMTVGSFGARVSSFFMDAIIISVAVIGVFFAFFATDFDIDVAYSLSSLFSFIVFNFYFIYFELAWRGRTPGKALYGLMVVNRHGGELTPTSIVARNLTRAVEVFIPLYFLTAMPFELIAGDYSGLLVAWFLIGAILPFITKDRLRLGDSIGGTMVIAKPKQVLAEDLSQSAPASPISFSFTPEQLSIYGYLELRALEDILRRADKLPMPKGFHVKGLVVVAQKIKIRLGYHDPIPPGLERSFLTDFYTSQRAVLERALLFGQQKWNQYLGLISISALAAGQLPPMAPLSPPQQPAHPGQPGAPLPLKGNFPRS
ncbi:MAG: RDD family protein [Deltaproteobacteria bacterium]|jgi:uncharacterized RDD family membrane protein YckC|nr:RDD family protein [Deltaproteobacteria bacterium]